MQLLSEFRPRHLSLLALAGLAVCIGAVLVLADLTRPWRALPSGVTCDGRGTSVGGPDGCARAAPE